MAEDNLACRDILCRMLPAHVDIQVRDVRQRCVDLGADAVFDKASELDEMLAYCAQRGEGMPMP